MDVDQPPHHEIHIPPKPREALEDRKLLDRPTRQEVLQSESWRVLRITSEFVAGFDHLAEVYPAVSIFGSARTQLANEYYDAAVRDVRGRVDLRVHGAPQGDAHRGAVRRHVERPSA